MEKNDLNGLKITKGWKTLFACWWKIIKDYGRVGVQMFHTGSKNIQGVSVQHNSSRRNSKLFHGDDRWRPLFPTVWKDLLNMFISLRLLLTHDLMRPCFDHHLLYNRIYQYRSPSIQSHLFPCPRDQEWIFSYFQEHPGSWEEAEKVASHVHTTFFRWCARNRFKKAAAIFSADLSRVAVGWTWCGRCKPHMFSLRLKQKVEKMKRSFHKLSQPIQSSHGNFSTRMLIMLHARTYPSISTGASVKTKTKQPPGAGDAFLLKVLKHPAVLNIALPLRLNLSNLPDILNCFETREHPYMPLTHGFSSVKMQCQPNGDVAVLPIQECQSHKQL